MRSHVTCRGCYLIVGVVTKRYVGSNISAEKWSIKVINPTNLGTNPLYKIRYRAIILKML